MLHDVVQTMIASFEERAQETDNSIEFWLARDIQHLLGYTKLDY